MVAPSLPKGPPSASRWVRWSLAALLAWALLALPNLAHAWTEARPSGIVTELVVDRDGGATTTLRIRWTVLAGRFHQFDLADLPTDLTLLEATATTTTGASIPVTTRSPAPGRLEVNLGDERGVRRCAVDIVLRYTTSLRANGAIQRAGDEAVLEVSTVPWSRGLEAVELRVALPSSVRRAQWISDETPGVDATTLTEPSHDVVRATRRHLPAATQWTAHIAVDPGIFPWLASGTTRRTQIVRRTPPPYGQAALLGIALVLVALALGRVVSARVPAPATVLPRRLRFAPHALAVLGVVSQCAWFLGFTRGLSLGTALLVGAAALRLPPHQPPSNGEATGRLRALTDADIRRARPRFPWSFVVGWTLATAASITLAVVSATRTMPALTLVAIDALVVCGAALALWLRSRALSDIGVLAPVARRVASLSRRPACARVAWRIRGDIATGGDLRLRWIPRPGWRHARGVRVVEWQAASHETPLGWTRAAVAKIQIESGSPLERRLRLLATKIGAVERSADGDTITFSVETIGPDAQIFFRALREMTHELFVKAPDATARGDVWAEDPACAEGHA